jgi:hypothetical protein
LSLTLFQIHHYYLLKHLTKNGLFLASSLEIFGLLKCSSVSTWVSTPYPPSQKKLASSH